MATALAGGGSEAVTKPRPYRPLAFETTSLLYPKKWGRRKSLAANLW